MKLYHNPISTYSQKVLLALYEKGIEFEEEIVKLFDDEGKAEYAKIYPMGKIPMLKPTPDHMVPESSIIIEYLEGHYPQGVKLIPDGVDESRQARFLERMIDLYVNDAMITLIFADKRTEHQLEQAKKYLDISYSNLNSKLEKNTWLLGEEFSVADCAAIPPLFYARKYHPFDEYPNLVAYFERAKKRESFQRVLAQAMPILKTMAL
jgi:glutathione S-transferase